MRGGACLKSWGWFVFLLFPVSLSTVLFLTISLFSSAPASFSAAFYLFIYLASFPQCDMDWVWDDCNAAETSATASLPVQTKGRISSRPVWSLCEACVKLVWSLCEAPLSHPMISESGLDSAGLSEPGQQILKGVQKRNSLLLSQHGRTQETEKRTGTELSKAMHLPPPKVDQAFEKRIIDGTYTDMIFLTIS